VCEERSRKRERKSQENLKGGRLKRETVKERERERERESM
jgi:hypothetical protein